ncbi:hypothetical protein MRX96_003956 [Rhipicephalus microplus]
MTSLEPLRVYVYRGDVLLRFCARPYDALHFNASDLDSYVVGDDYTPIWDMPSLARYYGSPTVVPCGPKWSGSWHRCTRARPRPCGDRHRAGLAWAASSSWCASTSCWTTHWACTCSEANMSPNLSSAHFPANGPFYEQLLFSLFSLVGLGASNSADDWRFLDRATSVLPSDCPVQPVDRRCEQPASLCAASCLSTAHKQAFRAALWEHLHRKQFARLVPRPDAGVEPEANMTEADRIMAQWYAAKCMQDSEWCR